MDVTQLAYSPAYPIDGNRWSENQSINRYQAIKLVNWYRLVSVNRWSIDNHSKIVHRLEQDLETDVTHANLSDHPPILGSPGDEIGKTISTQSAQRIYPVARVLELPTCPSLPFRVKMSSRDTWVEALLNIRCIVKGFIVFAVLRWTSVRCSVQTRREENGFFCRYRRLRKLT